MSSSFPSSANGLERLSNTIIPLFVPPPSTSTAPLLDGFAAAHDELMEDGSLFTHRADLANRRVNLEAAARELHRAEEAEKERAVAVEAGKVTEIDIKSLLSNTRKGRLRSRLHNQAAGVTNELGKPGKFPNTSLPSTPTGPEETRESILREFSERRQVFDREIAKEKEDALNDFKKNLREHMMAEARVMS